MTVRVWMAIVLAAVGSILVGCSDDRSAESAPTPETVTVTETVTAPPVPDVSMPTEIAVTPAPDDDAFRDTFTVTVGADGCQVERTPGDADNLTWTVTDETGAQVLGRNALGETVYRYFEGGSYSLELTAWGGDRYVPVSNRVRISC